MQTTAIRLSSKSFCYVLFSFLFLRPHLHRSIEEKKDKSLDSAWEGMPGVASHTTKKK